MIYTHNGRSIRVVPGQLWSYPDGAGKPNTIRVKSVSMCAGLYHSARAFGTVTRGFKRKTGGAGLLTLLNHGELLEDAPDPAEHAPRPPAVEAPTVRKTRTYAPKGVPEVTDRMREATRRYWAGESIRALAEEYGVRIDTIRKWYEKIAVHDEAKRYVG